MKDLKNETYIFGEDAKKFKESGNKLIFIDDVGVEMIRKGATTSNKSNNSSEVRCQYFRMTFYSMNTNQNTLT